VTFEADVGLMSNSYLLYVYISYMQIQIAFNSVSDAMQMHT